MTESPLETRPLTDFQLDEEESPPNCIKIKHLYVYQQRDKYKLYKHSNLEASINIPTQLILVACSSVKMLKTSYKQRLDIVSIRPHLLQFSSQHRLTIRS